MEKSGKKREMEVSRGDWAFVSAKFIAGGIGTFWIEGKAQNPRKKLKIKDFGVEGSGGYRTPDLRPLKGRCYW